MKKFALLTGFLFSMVLANANGTNTSSEIEDGIAKKEAVALNIQKFKMRVLKIKLSQADNMNQSIRLLKELKTTIEKAEKKLK